MNNGSVITFKKQAFKKNCAANMISNFIINGLICYLSNMNKEYFDVGGYWITILLTGLILPPIVGAIAMSSLQKSRAKGELNVYCYDKNEDLLARIFPETKGGQLIVITLILTVFFFIFGHGFMFVCGLSTELPVVLAAAVHGLQCALMALAAIYLSYVACLSSFKAEDESDELIH